MIRTIFITIVFSYKLVYCLQMESLLLLSVATEEGMEAKRFETSPLSQVT